MSLDTHKQGKTRLDSPMGQASHKINFGPNAYEIMVSSLNLTSNLYNGLCSLNLLDVKILAQPCTQAQIIHG